MKTYDVPQLWEAPETFKQMGATPKGKSLLPLGANSFISEKHPAIRETYSMSELFHLSMNVYPFPLNSYTDCANY